MENKLTLFKHPGDAVKDIILQFFRKSNQKNDNIRRHIANVLSVMKCLAGNIALKETWSELQDNQIGCQRSINILTEVKVCASQGRVKCSTIKWCVVDSPSITTKCCCIRQE
jgi:hypothetical protein